VIVYIMRQHILISRYSRGIHKQHLKQGHHLRGTHMRGTGSNHMGRGVTREKQLSNRLPKTMKGMAIKPLRFKM